MIHVSIVVPTYNRRESLHRLLTALAEQTYPTNAFEVIVIDDGSTDGTRDLLKSVRVPYSLGSFEQEHHGPAEARNFGASRAAGDLVLFLDDDVVPCRELISVHVATHTAHGPLAVVIGPMSAPTDWQRSAWVRWEEEKLEWQYEAMRAGVWRATERQFYTANSSLSRDLFARAGGFDSTFKRAEDVELGYRLRNVGAQFVFTPEADVLHYASRTFAAWCRTPYQYGRYDVIMTRDRGHEALSRALQEFQARHPLNRALSRLTVGRPTLLKPTLWILRAAVLGGDLVHSARLTSSALSAIFNLLYWQGVCDELGGRSVLGPSIAAGNLVPTNSSA
ncbi:MAG: glycosyltransferase [Chloroflexi bacterium]|nr:glycosyltransferase [Chloroflexota bacterium]MBV9545316.1 glycosyltransferase [Chloroflexota bacterium]